MSTQEGLRRQDHQAVQNPALNMSNQADSNISDGLPRVNSPISDGLEPQNPRQLKQNPLNKSEAVYANHAEPVWKGKPRWVPDGFTSLPTFRDATGTKRFPMVPTDVPSTNASKKPVSLDAHRANKANKVARIALGTAAAAAGGAFVAPAIIERVSPSSAEAASIAPNGAKAEISYQPETVTTTNFEMPAFASAGSSGEMGAVLVNGRYYPAEGGINAISGKFEYTTTTSVPLPADFYPWTAAISPSKRIKTLLGSNAMGDGQIWVQKIDATGVITEKTVVRENGHGQYISGKVTPDDLFVLASQQKLTGEPIVAQRISTTDWTITDTPLHAQNANDSTVRQFGSLAVSSLSPLVEPSQRIYSGNIVLFQRAGLFSAQFKPDFVEATQISNYPDYTDGKILEYTDATSHKIILVSETSVGQPKLIKFVDGIRTSEIVPNSSLYPNVSNSALTIDSYIYDEIRKNIIMATQLGDQIYLEVRPDDDAANLAKAQLISLSGALPQRAAGIASMSIRDGFLVMYIGQVSTDPNLPNEQIVRIMDIRNAYSGVFEAPVLNIKGEATVTPTATSTATSTPTNPPSSTPTETPTWSPTAVPPTFTPRPTDTATNTPTKTPTEKPSATPDATPTSSATPTPDATPNSPTPSETPKPATPTGTPVEVSPSPTPSDTPSPTPDATAPNSPTATGTPDKSPIATIPGWTATVSPTFPGATATATKEATVSVTPTKSPTPQLSPSATPAEKFKIFLQNIARAGRSGW